MKGTRKRKRRDDDDHHREAGPEGKQSTLPPAKRAATFVSAPPPPPPPPQEADLHALSLVSSVDLSPAHAAMSAVGDRSGACARTRQGRTRGSVDAQRQAPLLLRIPAEVATEFLVPHLSGPDLLALLQTCRLSARWVASMQGWKGAECVVYAALRSLEAPMPSFPSAPGVYTLVPSTGSAVRGWRPCAPVVGHRLVPHHHPATTRVPPARKFTAPPSFHGKTTTNVAVALVASEMAAPHTTATLKHARPFPGRTCTTLATNLLGGPTPLSGCLLLEDMLVAGIPARVAVGAFVAVRGPGGKGVAEVLESMCPNQEPAWPAAASIRPSDRAQLDMVAMCYRGEFPLPGGHADVFVCLKAGGPADHVLVGEQSPLWDAVAAAAKGPPPPPPRATPEAYLGGIDGQALRKSLEDARTEEWGLGMKGCDEVLPRGGGSAAFRRFLLARRKGEWVAHNGSVKATATVDTVCSVAELCASTVPPFIAAIGLRLPSVVAEVLVVHRAGYAVATKRAMRRYAVDVSAKEVVRVCRAVRGGT